MSGKISFEDLYQAQIFFQCKVEKQKHLPYDNPKLMQYHITGLQEEIGEILKADKRWKTHRNTAFIPAEKLDEIADCYIELMNISMWSGFTATEVLDAVQNKIVENNKRLERERE